MHAGVGQSAGEDLIQPVHEYRINTLYLLPYYHRTVILEEEDHVTPFLGAALVPCDHRAHVFASTEEAFYLRKMV